MGTAHEIAKDLSEAETALECFGYINVYNATPERLADLAERRMKLERRISELRKERAEWVAA